MGLKEKIEQVYHNIDSKIDSKQDQLTSEQLSSLNQLPTVIATYATQSYVNQQIQAAIGDALAAQY